MSPAKRERLGILLQDDDFEYIKRNMSRSVLTRTDHEKSNDLLGVINEEEFDSEREVSDYVDQIERNLDTGVEIHTKVDWGSDGKYTLTYKKILNTSQDVSNVIGKQIFVEIIEINGNKLTFTQKAMQ